MTAGTVVETVRAGAGALGTACPAQVGEWEGGRAGSLPPLILRVLGIRQAAQAAVLWRSGRRAHRLGAAVDGLHATSMVMLAVVSVRHRRAALAQVAIAAGFCLAEVAAAARSTR